MKAQCQLCLNSTFLNQIHFGHQPISHRFHNHLEPDSFKHPLEMGQCDRCGLVQILTPFSAKDLIPKFSWLTCTEPEGHLDRLVEKISKLPGLKQSSSILGLTFKEDSTLERFQKLGFKNTYRFSMTEDFKAENPLCNVETATDLFHRDFAIQFLHQKKFPKADVFICRHVIEHSIRVNEFLSAIDTLTHDDSYIIIEIPECGSAFELYDYTTVWEEHNLYFTPKLFVSFLKNSGFEIVEFFEEPYPLENAAIAILKKSKVKPHIEFINSNFENFVKAFPAQKKLVQEKLQSMMQHGFQTVLFGAGHMSVAFVNLYEVEPYITAIVDDNVNKLPYLLPGTQLPIIPSSRLYESPNIKNVLLTLAPESEEKVRNKHNSLIDQGIRFSSIFAKNPNYFFNV